MYRICRTVHLDFPISSNACLFISGRPRGSVRDESTFSYGILGRPRHRIDSKESSFTIVCPDAYLVAGTRSLGSACGLRVPSFSDTPNESPVALVSFTTVPGNLG